MAYKFNPTAKNHVGIAIKDGLQVTIAKNSYTASLSIPENKAGTWY